MKMMSFSGGSGISNLTDTIEQIQKNYHQHIYEKTRVYHGTYLGNGLVSCGGRTYPCQQVTDMFCNVGSAVYCQLVDGNYAVIIGG